MATTRRAMHEIENSQADLDLVAALLMSPSAAEAAIAFNLLRDCVSERHLTMLVNLREVLAEIPEAPFRTGEALDVLEAAGGYEATGRSYRRLFESAHGVFGIEFLGQANTCTGVVVHTAVSRYHLTRSHDVPDGATDAIDAALLALFVNHAILLDAIIEALALLGCPLEPTIYVTADDFIAEHRAQAASEVLGELF